MSKSILIIEDDPIIQELLETGIKSYTDYEAIKAEDGETALEIVKNTQPDLFIIDLLLPKMGGIALFYNLRNIENLKDIPVIFMSGTVIDEEFQQKVINMGVVDFIAKPLKIESFLEKIRNILENDS